jgi:putative two-component system response regulator
LATAAGWNSHDSRNLEMAATMHDLGKLAIPDSILLKPGKLNADEWQIMRTHTTTGYDILCKGSAEIVRLAATIALHHHERWDGSGYPQGLAGEAIPVAARIVAVADVFDALSMARPYKEPWPTDRVVATLIENAGTQFDPHMIEHFIRILPRILEIKNFWDAGASGELSAALVNRRD